jgi:hypothetical protein
MHPPTETPTPATARDINKVAKQIERLIELLAEKLKAENGMHDILSRAQASQTAVLLACDDSLKAFIAANAKAEQELEQLTRELIRDEDEERSIKTPLGTVKLTKSNRLVGPEDGGDEVVIMKIKAWAAGDLPARDEKLLGETKCADPLATFIHTELTLNREALEKLPAEMLNILGLRKVPHSTFGLAYKKLSATDAQAVLLKAKAKQEGGAS